MKNSDRLAPLKSLGLTALCQFVGISFSSGIAAMGLPFLLLFILHSLISGYLSIFFRLSKPWRFLNFMIPAGLLVSIAFPGYGWIWLVLMVVFGLLFLPTFWTRVPYYPSSQKVYDLITKELPQNQVFRFIDIGCGDGKLLAYLSSRFPLAVFEGVDLSPSALLAAKLNNWSNRNVKIRYGNYWNLPFENYDFIYAFLSPTPMLELEQKAKAELKADAKLLVNSFALPSWDPYRELKIGDKNQSSLYIYSRT